MSKVFFVEGNISSGKSTFLSQIQNYLDDVQIIYEPLDIWTSISDKDNKNILEYFYTNQERYAYAFQTIAFLSRIKMLKDIDMTKKYIFIERSIFSDKKIFAENCYESGLLNEIEWKLYNKWFEWVNEDVVLPTHQIIYLKCSPETCYKRLCKRSRKEEQTVALDYLTQIDNKHDNWLNKKEHIVLDAEKEVKDVIDEFLYGYI